MRRLATAMAAVTALLLAGGATGGARADDATDADEPAGSGSVTTAPAQDIPPDLPPTPPGGATAPWVPDGSAPQPSSTDDQARPTDPPPAPDAYTYARAPRESTVDDGDERAAPPPPIAGEDEELADPIEPPVIGLPASIGHVFWLPTARASGPGVSGEYVSALGWFGIRVGLGDRVDVGIGLPVYLSGVSADVRVAPISGDGYAVALYGYASLPVTRDEHADFSLDSTGLAYAVGPTASLWGDEAAVHAGIHFGGRTARGGLWLLAHSSLELRVTRLVSALLSGVALVEVSREQDGPPEPRTFPYVAAGARIGGRVFAVDCGLLIPLDAQAPGKLARLPVTPLLAMGHRW